MTAGGDYNPLGGSVFRFPVMTGQRLASDAALARFQQRENGTAFDLHCVRPVL